MANGEPHWWYEQNKPQNQNWQQFGPVRINTNAPVELLPTLFQIAKQAQSMTQPAQPKAPTPVQRWVTSDGQQYNTEADAQKQELFLSLLPVLKHLHEDTNGIGLGRDKSRDTDAVRKAIFTLADHYDFVLKVPVPEVIHQPKGRYTDDRQDHPGGRHF